MTLTLPQTYEVICEFANLSDPSVKWRNTCTMHADTTPVPGNPCEFAFSSFMVAMIHGDAQLVQTSVYAWARGGPSPYPSGLPIYVTTYNLPGTADSQWGYTGTEVPLGGEVCLLLKKTVNAPPALKPGKMFMRGLLREGDVQAETGGRWSFAPGTPITATKLATIIQASSLNNFLGIHYQGSGFYLALAAYSKKHATAGPSTLIHDFVIDDVSTNKISRKGKK